jgi:thioredoxin 1
MLTDVTDDDFDGTVLAGPRPVLVDFWADWCAPCRALAPVLEDMAVEYADTVDIVKLDIVANAAVTKRLGVQSIPLLVMFRDGKEVARASGSMSRTRLAVFIEDNVTEGG